MAVRRADQVGESLRYEEAVRRDRRRWLDRWGRVVVAVGLAAQGLVHLVGVELLWKLDQPGLLRYRDAVPTPGTPAGIIVGGLWLMAMLLFVASGWALLRRRRRWCYLAIGAVLVSLPLLLVNSQVGLAGPIVDGLVLVLAVPPAMVIARRG